MKGNAKSNTVTITAKMVTEETKVVTLTADTTSLEVDATVTFSIDCNGENVTTASEVFNANGNVKLESNTFTTDKEGEYTFYAMYEGEKSNSVVVTFNKKSNVVSPDELTLSAEPNTIVADGIEKAIFTLKKGDNTITDYELYNANDDTKLAAKEFSTTEAGSYSFYAMYEGKKSNNVAITARMNIVEEEKPLEIEATATTIKANGVDSTKFIVTQDGANVTDSATIYVNGGKLNGNRFVTTTPGTYTVYAEKGTVKSNEITITAEEVTATGKSIVFAEGVTLTSGWYDVNKFKMGNNGDIQMCWAASASNIIQWWQDRYVAHGGTLPTTAVNGPSTKTYDTGCKYQLALMDMFHSEWDNSLGGHVNEAIPWYFEGSLNGGEYAAANSQAVPKTEGGYWKSVWPSIMENMYCGYDQVLPPTFETSYSYTVRYNNYYLWGNGTSYEGNERLKIVSDIVVNAFEHGMASLTIALSANIYTLHHAVTLWGYEIDNATGLLTRVWITDSDDMETEPKREILHEMTVSIGEGKSHIQFSSPDIRYKNVWLVGVVPVAGPDSAE
ncbi:MAG: IdeS/Mac family cysteine endopeptidase [Alistipes sp.]|nr:IdeS/Mac family cysteine endopeptidase [Alistipes sp.]